ncbi:MAG: Ltp family lipoprotein [Oscillibacter sp.]|nr:Ltp family lipoprotein [Oscillibacter sp.]
MKWNQLCCVAGALCLTFALAGCGGEQALPETNNEEPAVLSEVSDTASVPEVEEEAMESALPPASEVMTAAEDVQNYLNIMALSRQTLIDQLLYDGFSEEEAVSAVDSCGADWNEQAAKQARSYLDTMEFTRDELIEQLVADRFTPEEATYGVDNCGENWK